MEKLQSIEKKKIYDSSGQTLDVSLGCDEFALEMSPVAITKPKMTHLDEKVCIEKLTISK